jgi:hypothetical protein
MLKLFRTIANKLSSPRARARQRFRVTFTVFHDMKVVSNFEMVVVAWNKPHAEMIVKTLVLIKPTAIVKCQ